MTNRFAWKWMGALFVASMYFAISPHHVHAYAWMIRHDYTGCATCHADPSGGGLLTEYGRAQGDLLLRMRYGSPNTEEPDSTAGFAGGLVTPPEWLLLGGDARGMGLLVKTGKGPMATDFILMQADAAAEVRLGGFRAAASVGVISTDQSAASIAGPLVSREHYLGYSFLDDSLLLRVGRINLPFGVRSIEHTLLVRQATRTDLNDTQEHGVALAYTSTLIRAEVMGILGNYQIRPDAFRERGYSAYAEITPVSWAAFGVSSLITHAAKDIYLGAANTRHAHGAFVRMAPLHPLVLLAEWDFVANALHGTRTQSGYAGMLQADLELIQGLHVIATAETARNGVPMGGQSWNVWGGINWFFLPHMDVRLDVMHGVTAVAANDIPTTAYMAQLHLYL